VRIREKPSPDSKTDHDNSVSLPFSETDEAKYFVRHIA